MSFKFGLMETKEGTDRTGKQRHAPLNFTARPFPGELDLSSAVQRSEPDGRMLQGNWIGCIIGTEARRASAKVKGRRPRTRGR